MKTKQLPHDFRDWIRARTFAIGVQEAVEPFESPGAIPDAGGGGADFDWRDEHGAERLGRGRIDQRRFFRTRW